MPLVTDATPQRPALARARARVNARAAALAARSVTGSPNDPVAEMPLQPLVTIAVIALAGLLTISAYAGPVLVALSVALAAGVITWGWSGLLRLPSPRGTAFVLAVGSAAAIGTVLATPDAPFLRRMPVAMAGSLIVAFLHQLARRDGRPRLVESIASNTTAIAIVVSGAILVALPRAQHGPLVVAIASSAVAVSALTDLAGGSRRFSQRFRAWLAPVAMLAGGAVAIGVGHLLGAGSWGAPALLGLLAAGVSHAVRRVLAVLPAISGARSQLVSASSSVLTIGVVVYVVGWLFFF
jgi:hypothetical protein